jgi:CheY-like chemotaxis protein
MSSRESSTESSTNDTGLPETKPRLLVVDDEEMVRLVIKTVLVYRGYEVTEAADGEEAVAKYMKAGVPFDLVLLDLHMPRLNGYEAILRIRELNPHAKAIFMSGGIREVEEQGIRDLSGVHLLHKPFENQELLRMVAEVLARRLP